MLTAIGSDYCHELVFPTEPSRRASDEDMALSITTSEHTPNIISLKALEQCDAIRVLSMVSCRRVGGTTKLMPNDRIVDLA